MSMLSEDSEGLAALRRIEERPIVVPLSATVAAGGDKRLPFLLHRPSSQSLLLI